MSAPRAHQAPLPELQPKPLVSVVTPSLDQGRFIEAAIRSVAEQDYERIEHIVVDGGSTDETLAILRNHDVRWTSEPDEGQADAVNKGISRARGQIIGWLNADDFYLPGAVTSAVRTLREHVCGMVYSNYIDVDEDGTVLRENKTRSFDLASQVNEVNLVPQPTAFLRREVLEDVGGLNADYHYAMDFDLWIKVGRRYPIVYVDEFWAAFRYHSQSKSVAQQDRFWREMRQISRSNGGRFFSGHLWTHVYERNELAGKAVFKLRRLAREVR